MYRVNKKNRIYKLFYGSGVLFIVNIIFIDMTSANL